MRIYKAEWAAIGILPAEIGRTVQGAGRMAENHFAGAFCGQEGGGLYPFRHGSGYCRFAGEKEGVSTAPENKFMLHA